jgi:hypothetical protein
VGSNRRTVRWTFFSSACIGAGVAWLFAVLYVIVGGVILRETALGKLAEQIDRLPPWVATPIFVLSWCVFFFGWSIPVAMGVMALFRRRGV